MAPLVVACGLIAVAAAAEPAATPFDTARQHFQKGRLDEALELYDELDKAGEDPARVAIGRSNCLRARGELPLAAEALAAAEKRDANNPHVVAHQAELALAQGDYPLCAERVERALALDPESPRAHLVQTNLFVATGRLKEAEEGFRWFVRYYNRAQPADAETLVLVAQGAAQYARWKSVTQVFDFVVNTLCPDALKADPDYWQAHLVSGSLLLEKFNRAQAMPELRHALRINPRAADVHAALAESSYQEHALADAAQHAARALEINPRHVGALLVTADLRLEDGDLAAARRLAEQALEVNPHHEAALARLSACDLLEDPAPSAEDLASLFDNLDAPAEATVAHPSRFTKTLAALASRNPHPGVYLGALAERLEARRKFDLAEQFYRQAMKSMPQLAAPKSSLGMLYMRVGRNADAAEILDQAFEADPYHVRVSNMRKVLKLLDGYENVATDHFVIRVDGQADRILARYMAEFLEEEYPALVRQFGFEPAARTQFEIFHKAKGLSAHQWFSARMVGLPWVQTIGASTGMIVALASPTASPRPFNWARVLKHEFVHILTLQQTQFNIPHWYTEALAVTAEGYPRPESWNRLLLERVPAGNVMNLDTINLGFIRPKTPDDWNMAYCQSRLYAQYMTEKFGPDSTARLLAAYRENLPTERAISRVFGIDKAEFEKGYRAYLEALVAGLRTLQPEPAMTLAQAEKAHKADTADPHAAARYAYELLRINRRKDARRLAEEALAANASEPLAAVVLAQLALRAEDLDGAVARLEPALNREAPHPEVLSLLAELRLKQQEFTEAAALYDLGLARDPEHLAWLKGLAFALIKGKQKDRVKETLDRIALADADDAGVRQKLAQLALDAGDHAEAVRYGRMALHVDVLDVDTHKVLARAYAGLGQHDKSAAEWSVALELKPDDTGSAIELARAEAAAGRKDAARERLHKLLEKSPDLAPAKKLLEELE